MVDPTLANAPLGHDVSYPKAYDPTLLFPIARDTNRQTLEIHPNWYGADIWNAYEISWLNLKGKPVVAMARFVFAHSSPSLIESKSFKLYLNSFNEARFDSSNAVAAQMRNDLERAAGAEVGVTITPLNSMDTEIYNVLEGENIDDLDIEVSTYQPAPGLLQCVPNAQIVSETLVSDLLKSNCPVTGQPDWGSVQVRYTGTQIDRAALLKYIISLRQHNEFHEHCVEKMYCDIWQACQPTSLLVYARYTRRGGLDINPWRGSEAFEVSQARTLRQ
jgi:7-cyano-7-deazaguanine reductase